LCVCVCVLNNPPSFETPSPMTRDEIYTPLEEARDEIRRRWADRDLRRRVEEFLGGTPPGRRRRAPCLPFQDHPQPELRI